MVGLLLGREDVDHKLSHEVGGTPLASAAVFGRERPVKLLLPQNSVSPNKSNNELRTQLGCLLAMTAAS